MKIFAHAGIALVFVLTLMFATACQKDAAALNINEVAADPAAYVGTITINGVTAGFAPGDPSLFGVMDVKELQCTSPNCHKVLIPVRYKGEIPSLGDEVRISGSFVSMGNGYLFTAETVKVVRNHKLGS